MGESVVTDWLLVGCMCGLTVNHIVYDNPEPLVAFGIGWLHGIVAAVVVTATVFVFGIALARTVEECT